MISDPYAANIAKEYRHWTVYVYSGGQSRIGRCIVWCKRENALDLADATLEEREELFEIVGRLRKATGNLWGATWFNYAFLGNVDRHLHCHFIPRYEKPVSFKGMTFVDEDYHGNPFKSGDGEPPSPTMLESIRAALAGVL